jgi:DNA-binding transcriptional regulator LsrR (DeoR family)
MTRLRRSASQFAASDDRSLRIRACWLYYNQGLTQKEVSEHLGISRGTAIRVLNEALERGEVQIWIAEGETESVELAVQLETAFGLDEAIVVPAVASTPDPAKAVGLALGKFLSEALTNNMTVGVGWGRTLMASLASLRPTRHESMKIVSLLGGVVEARGSNPLEFSWRMANQFGADCYLFVAPAFVDSLATKRRLIEKCGLDKLYQLGRALDVAIVSVGDINTNATSLSAQIISRSELTEILDLGCVSDVLCNFLDAEGRSVPHELNKRVMSIDLDDLRSAGHVVIATGGAHRAEAMRSAIRRIGCNTLVTDEPAARALLKLAATDASARPKPAK